MITLLAKLLMKSMVLICLTMTSVHAQSTEFTYQGRLLSGAVPADGSHDFEFSLWDGDSGGNQIGTIITLTQVNVNNGVFSVRLDFGNVFPGANRFLEIKVRQSGVAEFTTLTPRQAITSAPYSIKSLNAQTAVTANTATNAIQLGGLNRSQFVITTDPRLDDARNPLPNSPNYIRNSTLPQALSNFNITGTGTANIFNASRFDISGNRVLSIPGLNNIFAGAGAGQNTTGPGNSFFGSQTGAVNSSGGGNTFLGFLAGGAATTGNSNTFIGAQTGSSNTTGGGNTLIGAFTNVGSSNLVAATAIGFGAIVSSSNTIALGRNNGADTVQIPGPLIANANIGIGTTAPSAPIHVRANNGNLLMGHAGCGSGLVGIGFGTSLSGCNNYSLLGNATDTVVSRPVGGTLFFREGNSTQMSIAPGGALTLAGDLTVNRPAGGTVMTVTNGNVDINGTLDVSNHVRVGNLDSGGTASLCRNAEKSISNCSSSIRYKTNISSFHPGLDLIKRLRPVSFNWKSDKSLDFGLVAEEVAEVAPLLITKNDNGVIEGVKYDRIGVVLVNAVNEQQSEIESQKTKIELQQQQVREQAETIKRQQGEIDGLKKFLRSQNSAAEICRPKN